MQSQHKTIGVLGGMGPYATVDFLNLLLKLTGAEVERDNFRVVTDSNPKIPSRTRAYLFNEDDPVPMMKSSVDSLYLAGADFVVIPCNSAHYFLPRVFNESGKKYIDMISATARAIHRRGWKKVGLLAGEVTVGARLYEEALAPYDICVEQVNEEEQKLVREVIEDVKNDKVRPNTGLMISGLIDVLVGRGAQSIVLACTELQAVIKNIECQYPILDSLEVLAAEAILEAGGVDENQVDS